MPSESVERKVERLEERVNAIEQLPARIDGLGLQILQLREEMRIEFSAVRCEMAAGDELVSARIEDARRETRVLHENAIGRIAVIGEGLEALSENVTSLFQRFDRTEITLSKRIDRTDAKLDLILARLDPPVAKRKNKRGDRKA